MKLKKLQLENVCQHEKLEIEFQSGINGIIGPNGSGKTNMLRSIPFALTGDWPTTGTKEQRVRRGAKAGTVTLWIEANGHEYKITRALHTSRSRITCPELKIDLAKREEVDKYIEGLLGTSGRLLDTFVFVPQGQLQRVITARPADRAGYFSVLFGTDHCEKIREKLTEALTSAVQATPTVDRDLVLKQQGQLLTDKQKATDTITNASAYLAGRDLQALRVQVGSAQQNASAFNHPEHGMEATKSRIDVLSAQLENVDRDLANREQNAAQIRQTLNEIQTTLTDHKIAVAQRADLERRRMQHQGLRHSLEEKTKALTTHNANQPVEVPDRDKEMADLEQTLRSKEQRASEIHQQLHGLSSGHCSFCGTYAIIDVSGNQQPIAPLVQTLTTELTTLQPAITSLQTEVSSYRRAREGYIRAFGAWEPMGRQLLAAVKQFEEMLSNTPDPGELPSIEESHRVLAIAAQAENSLSQVEYHLTNLRSNQRKLIEELAQRKARLEQLSAITLQDYSKAKAELDLLEQASNDMKIAEANIKQLESSLAYVNQQLDLLDQQQKSQQTLANWRSLLSSAAGVLHRDQYPAAIARRQYGKINAQWNHFVSMMDQRFDVHIAQDAVIQIRQPNGVFSIEEGSGGQVACCAVAFYCAINQLYAHNVGLLVLDEPTYGPDAGHVPLIRDALIELSRWAVGGNLQVLVVTHDDRLAPAFSNKIELAEVV